MKIEKQKDYIACRDSQKYRNKNRTESKAEEKSLKTKRRSES